MGIGRTSEAEEAGLVAITRRVCRFEVFIHILLSYLNTASSVYRMANSDNFSCGFFHYLIFMSDNRNNRGIRWLGKKILFEVTSR